MNTMHIRIASSLLAASSLMAIAAPVAAQGNTAAQATFNIPAGDLAGALQRFARQSRTQVIYSAAELRGRRTQGVSGRLLPAEALQRLVDGSGATLIQDSSGAFLVRASHESGEAEAGGAAADSGSADTGATPEILVVGNRIQNVDIARTEDDVRPYVVFGAEEIAQSQAQTPEEFLRTRLPQNTAQGVRSPLDFTAGNRSQINLRGLGVNQTLVLIDGRRAQGTYSTTDLGEFQFDQPDINGIPIAAIDRIEVLPATASGIYGGGATGGVVNIILRRDYEGLTLGATYGNTLDGEAASIRLDATAGLSVEGGRTRFLFTASHFEQSDLLVSERDFASRARAVLAVNRPVFLGTPPSGFTSNIRSSNGSNLVLDNGQSLGSPITFVPVGYAGPLSDGGAALVANAGRYNLELPDEAPGLRSRLFASPTVDSISINARRNFASWLDIYADLAWSQNVGESTTSGSVSRFVTLPANAPNNPFTTAIRVAFPKVGLLFPFRVEDRSLRATGGAVVRLGSGWSLSLDYIWNRARSEIISTTNPLTPAGNSALANGGIDILRDLNAFPQDYGSFLRPTPNSRSGPRTTTLNDANMRAAGPVLALPGGSMTVSAGIEWRRERGAGAYSDNTLIAGTIITFAPPKSQEIWSAYVEASAPIISAANDISLVHELVLEAAVRYDHYDTRSSAGAIVVASRDGPLPSIAFQSNEVDAATYTAGVRYAPTPDIAFRASYSTGFLPPSIAQIASNAPVIAFEDFIDPRRGGTNEQLDVEETFGGNPNLLPEESRSLSLGLVLNPRAISGFRFSVDYVRTTKTNEIFFPQLQQILNLESLFPRRVTRGAPLPGDPPGFAGPVIAADLTAINVARTRVEALDFQLNYEWQIAGAGRFNFYAVATRMLHFVRRLVPDADAIETVGFADGPLRWRGNVGLSWRLGRWSAGWNAQYYHSYLVYSSTSSDADRESITTAQGGRRVASQLYNDLFVRYRIGEQAPSGWPLLRNVEISLGVQNVLNHRPPLVAESSFTGGYSPYGDPRLRRFSLGLRKSF